MRDNKNSKAGKGKITSHRLQRGLKFENGNKPFPFIIALLSSIFIFVRPGIPTFAIVGIVLTLIASWFFLTYNKVFSVKYLLTTLLIIWIIYFFHWFTNPQQIMSNISIIAYIVSSVVWMLIIPQITTQRQFIDVISLLGPILVLIGIPSVINGAYLIGPFEITAYHHMINFPIDMGIYQMSSIFLNPNSFGVFMLGSTLCSIDYFDHRRSMTSAIPFFFSSIGLFMSNSRGAIVGAIAGLIIIFSYKYGGRAVLGMITIFGSLGSIIFVLSVLQVVPIGVIESVDLTGRGQIWRGTLRAILKQPILGYGPGDVGSHIEPFMDGAYAGRQPHNSYLRIFLTTGVIGGLTYLSLIGKTILDAVKIVSSNSEVVIFGVLCAILVNQIFAGDSLFGLSSSSAIGAMALGFCAKFVMESSTNNSEF